MTLSGYRIFEAPDPDKEDDLAELLLHAYPVPNPHRSDEQLDRYHGQDIPSLTRADRARELTVLRLINFLADSAWHQEREVAILSTLAGEEQRRVPPPIPLPVQHLSASTA